MNTKINKQVVEFLITDSFVNYVLDPTSSLIESWEKYLRNNPDKIEFANEAKQILLERENIVQMPPFEVIELKNRIFDACNLPLTS